MTQASFCAVDAANAAREYLRAGWTPLPLPRGSKAPVLKGWTDFRITEADVPMRFPESCNVGVLLGEPSGGLIDVDLDTPEAVKLAPRFLPETGAVFGRPGNPASHWLYVSGDSIQTERYHDQAGTTLLELRSTRTQTVFPPSHHSGETVAWFRNGLPARVNGEVLRAAARRLAAAVLLARHWPAAGGRQDCAMALAGGLCRSGWSETRAAEFIAAVAEAAGDEEFGKRAQAAESTARRQANGESSTGWQRLMELIGAKIVTRALELLGLQLQYPPESKTAKREEQSCDRGSSQAEALVSLGRGGQLFRTAEGEAYASVQVNGHTETHAIRSKAFKAWLRHSHYCQAGRTAGSQALQDALSQLESLAQYSGIEEPVFLRVGAFEGDIYIDLCNPNWEAVRVTPYGWEVVPNPPIHFRRTKSMQPLPKPQLGGAVETLRQYLNVASEQAWMLVTAFLVGAFRPGGPYPLLILVGEAGSAKSTAARLLRMLVDPCIPPSRTFPRDERDLMIGARNAWLLSFDNLSGLSPASSDALCRLSSAGGLAARELFSDSDEVILDATRPVVLNGIDDMAGRADLADRALLVTLSRISDEQRKTEATIMESFERDRPMIFGALLTAVSGALRNVHRIQLAACPRMADFAVWISAAEEALGWSAGSFLEVYREQRREAAAESLESDDVVRLLVELLQREPEWSGTATELLSVLNSLTAEADRRGRDWPKNAQTLSFRVQRASPHLRNLGIDVVSSREPRTRRRIVSLRQMAQACVPTVPSVPEPCVSRDSSGDDAERADGACVPTASPAEAFSPNALDGGDDRYAPNTALSSEVPVAGVRAFDHQAGA